VRRGGVRESAASQSAQPQVESTVDLPSDKGFEVAAVRTARTAVAQQILAAGR